MPLTPEQRASIKQTVRQQIADHVQNCNCTFVPAFPITDLAQVEEATALIEEEANLVLYNILNPAPVAPQAACGCGNDEWGEFVFCETHHAERVAEEQKLIDEIRNSKIEGDPDPRENPYVRYLHFILLARRQGVEGDWPTSMLRDHDLDAHAVFARGVFEELVEKGYMTVEHFGVSFHAGKRYTVTPEGKAYFLSLDTQKSEG